MKEDTMSAYCVQEAWSTDYWTGDNFTSFLRWYAKTELISVNDIIDIVERPWKKPYREAFETYLKEIYDDESE